MASTISAGTTTTTALSYSADTSGVLQLQTNGGTTALTLDTSQNATFAGKVASASSLQLATNGTTTAVTIDTSQNFGVGVTPSAWGSSYKAVQMSNATMMNTSAGGYYGANFYYNSSGSPTYVNNGYALAYSAYSAGGAHLWLTATSGTAGNAITFTQAMTLDISGNLLVGTTSPGIANTNSISIQPTRDANGDIIINHATGAASGQNYLIFGYAGGLIGSITQAGTTAVLYNTTSDYRLKSNVVPVTTGLSVINQLNPVNFTWISDNESDTGFLAHEFQTVIPRSVTGTKDATIEEEYEVTPAVKDEQGNITTPTVMGTRTVPVYQQMDNSGAVPYLVAAIKELSTQVTTLQTQVTALKG